MSGPEIISFGCRLNAVESEEMRAIAIAEDDLVIVNSCAVTAEAVRQAGQAIRRARRARPDAHILVTGCAAQIDPARFAAMPEVDAVVGNREKLTASLLASGGSRVRVSDIMRVRETAPHLASGFATRARAFVEVQNGCDHRCTFCVIPYGRGNARSVPAGAVIEQIRTLAGEGFEEIVLTGVDVTSYGVDLPGAPALGQLVERILRLVPELPRLRLSSLDSVEIDERLFELIAYEPRLMPHVHLSLQAGDDLVLKRMRRRHSRAQAVAIVQQLKAERADIAIGADLIAGFPTETETMAANTLALIDDCDISLAHIFPYSPRPGTPAARMPQVPQAAIRTRARQLREAAARRKRAWLDGMIGSRQRVLVERNGRGHAENFAEVEVDGAEAVGRTLEVRITERRDDRLVAVAA